MASGGRNVKVSWKNELKSGVRDDRWESKVNLGMTTDNADKKWRRMPLKIKALFLNGKSISVLVNIHQQVAVFLAHLWYD